MKYINYVDFPTVPAELLEQPADILAKPKIATVTDKDFFQLRAASDELIEWCWANIKSVPFNFRAQYQIIGHGIPIHRDQALPNGQPRTLAFNYLLDCGGDAVATQIYNDQHEVVETEIIKPLRWHSIKVNNLHSVVGLTPGRFRVALSLAPTGL